MKSVIKKTAEKLVSAAAFAAAICIYGCAIGALAHLALKMFLFGWRCI